MDLKFRVFENIGLVFNHPEFDRSWNIKMSILFDQQDLVHFIIPFKEDIEKTQGFICNVHLTNVFIGDINKLKVSGLSLENSRLLKGTIKPIFTELANIFLLDIEYDGVA